ncbi:hypothetical protein PLEOSDRAFT_159875 [Pleurotus ostreatus PC15]|uniref:Uncharacterized protein n=1 Tax=Pleurotus ostreatus (strain PC15) TaxID=1137138 RepID=A0A067NNN9_PLEO1|nr:hypothetical protein PLEOSDRAFT_159875 [Pleurotus ostreatus PC15]
MAPHSKSSPEQLVYLTGLLDKFLEAQKHGRFDKFWPELFRGWFEQWHEEEDMSIVDEGERKSDLGVRLGKRQEYLKRWFQNKTAAKTRAPPKELPPQEGLKTVRRPQLLQLYTKKYYKTRIRSKIYDGLPAGTKLSSGAFLALLQKMTPNLFELEDKAIKKEIEDRYEALKKHVEEREQAQPPVQTIAARYAAVHFRLDDAGQHFGKATPAFGDTVLTPYATFLNTLYTKAECDARSLIPINPRFSSPADSPLASATTLPPSGQAVVENPMGHVITQPLSAPTLPVPFPAPGAPVPDFDEFDWSEWATFNGTPTIPYKASDTPFDRDGVLGSILDELAADLPEYITSTSDMSVNGMAPITAASATAATPSAVPTSPALAPPVITPVLPAAVLPSAPVLSMPAVPEAPILPAAVLPSDPVLSIPAAPITADIGPLTDIDDPAMLPLRPRKRARDATEDPSFIVTGKHI